MRRVRLDQAAVRQNQTPHMSLLLVGSRIVAGEDDGDEGGRLVMLAGNVDIRISALLCAWMELESEIQR